MIAAGCCSIAEPTPAGLPALGWVMLAVALVLVAEAVAVAWRFRREPPPLWRRKLTVLPAVLAVPAVLLAFQVWSLYGQYVAKYGLHFAEIIFTSDSNTPLDHAIAGASWLCGMLIVATLCLLAVGVYQLLAAN
ncbi:MAG TPA: hypothetical protein VFY89_10365 [Ktedonobacterales bacterium]